MLHLINKRRSRFVGLLMLLYLASNFGAATSEVLHLCLHIGDIVQLDYKHHSHSDTELSTKLLHNHNGVINQSNSDPLEKEDVLSNVNLDKVEYSKPDNIQLLSFAFFKRKIYYFLRTKTQLHTNIIVPPPQESRLV